MTRNAYIHIPFCKQKCHYCSFVSFPKIELKQEYLQKLYQEIRHFYKKETLNTLYFGGGTPSVLTSDEFKIFISIFNTHNQTEITAELNPENITEAYLKNLKLAGINRLSLGCQTFDDQILKQIGRRHSADDVQNVVKLAYQTGFDNISLDFIYGLPNQSIQDFENDLKKAISLDIQHVSLYGLKIDENCYFYTAPPANLPDDDLQADMYLKAVEILTCAGFEHYEISNFAKPGFYSRHNLNYWENNSYYGFGLGAHGYVDGVRYENHIDFSKYFAHPTKHLKTHVLTLQECIEEEIFLGFRKTVGVSPKELARKYNIDFESEYKEVLEKYIDSGHIEKVAGKYRLSTSGILVSNIILADFI